LRICTVKKENGAVVKGTMKANFDWGRLPFRIVISIMVLMIYYGLFYQLDRPHAFIFGKGVGALLFIWCIGLFDKR